MFWTHSLVTRHDEHKVMRSTTVRNKVKPSGIYALSVTAKTKPYKERFSPRISRLVKTACNIFYISLAVLKLITCVPKISDFFPSRLGYWQVFGACQYFPSPWRWAGQTVIFCICSSVISNKPALANIGSFSDTLSLKRWCLIRCVLILALHPFKCTDSLHPRLLSHLLLVMLENEHKAPGHSSMQIMRIFSIRIFNYPRRNANISDVLSIKFAYSSIWN